MEKEEFMTLVDRSIDVTINEIISRKTMTEQTLNYIDAQTISMKIKNMFSSKLGKVPPQIEFACKISEVILAPSTTEKAELLKKAYSLTGGLAGIAAIIGGIGMALGWGAGVIAAVTTFFTGAAVLGPLGLAVAGIGITTIAGYFALKKDDALNDENYRKTLKEGVKQAVDVIWEDYKEELSKVETESTK